MEHSTQQTAHKTPYQIEHAKAFAQFLWRQKVILAVAFVGYVCAYLVRNNFKLMSKSMIDVYGWNKLNVATLLTCFAVTYGIGKFVMGALADRVSLRKLFGGALAMSALLCILMGFTHNFWVIAIILIAVGLIQGALAPSSQAMIAQYFPNTTRGAAVAGWNVSQNVGSALLPLIIAGLAVVAPGNLALGFILPGVFVLVIAIFIWKFGGDNPQSEGFGTLREMYGEQGEPNVEGADSVSTMPYWELIRKYVFLNPGILLVGFINAALYFVRFGIEDWMPIYLSSQHFSEQQALTAVSMLEWVAIPGTLLFAWLAVKFANRMTVIGASGLFVMAALVFYYESLSNTGNASYIQLLVVSGLLGTLIYGPQLIVNILTLNFVPLKVSGTALGFVGLMAYIIGNLGANWIMPILADTLSWTMSYLVVALLSALSGIGYLVLSRKEKRTVTID
ncbi:putative glycerol-3-phosphate transporter [Galliscardovia ingluviei]|uniref:Putative glycerol-3-phosphate transporter n=1 Tax=Galliscardovia ingluviei TaxID=1769422 RepID=A0A8J3ALJ8_9BIFI|nr:MFS transporter [Galliscardovia ingluviei]GGI13112.1 putative glycerol-3-phosphate transporter [Galliscardovia ingluviei]